MTSAKSAAKKSTIASAEPRSPKKPKRWLLADERKAPKEPNAGYIKYLFDNYETISQGQRRICLRAAQYYGLPVDYPPAEFNEEDRRESYANRRHE